MTFLLCLIAEIARRYDDQELYLKLGLEFAVWTWRDWYEDGRLFDADVWRMRGTVFAFTLRWRPLVFRWTRPESIEPGWMRGEA